jgi:hypothetical protein
MADAAFDRDPAIGHLTAYRPISGVAAKKV